MNCSGPIIRLRLSQKHQARPDKRVQKRTKQSLQPSTTKHSAIPDQSEAAPQDFSLPSVFNTSELDGNFAFSPSYGDDGWIDEAFRGIMPELMSFGLIRNPTTTSIQTPGLLQMTDECSPKGSLQQQDEILASPIASLPFDTNRPQTVSSQSVQVVETPQPYTSTVVDRLFNDYSTILVRSMAASFLSNVYPQLLNTGLHFRQKAIRLFDDLDDSAIHEQPLIALFMIGGTATFVVDEDENEVFDSPHLPLLRADPDPEPGSIFPVVQIPHPVTGVAHEIHTTLARVGRLVRRNRRRVMSKQFLTRESILEAHREVDEAAELEMFLTNLQVPLESAIVQTGDSQTPTWHLTALAEVYRLVGLIQLYHVFPDTLVSRMNLQNSHAGGEVVPVSAHEAEERLRQFTLKAVEILRSIPAESGTKDFHPFLIVAVCSALTIPVVEVSASPQSMSGLGNSLALVAADVHRARGFLRGRLQLLLHSLPKNPIQRCIDIVEATWSETDNRSGSSGRPAYWMDVMMQNNWETFMA
ncbi:hypothetical protein FBULB1_10497 [Fusarium bulbicola]|nr:hypothetical protein FBULB1_10497 [Fusarium bulbicola]